MASARSRMGKIQHDWVDTYAQQMHSLIKWSVEKKFSCNEYGFFLLIKFDKPLKAD